MVSQNIPHDYQYLNSQCKRETHHTASPFQLAMQVPPNTKKTMLDTVDGYHSVILDEESQPLTTFISSSVLSVGVCVEYLGSTVIFSSDESHSIMISCFFFTHCHDCWLLSLFS